jgi:hypothetical protein
LATQLRGGQGEHPGADGLAGCLDRAAGHPGLAGCRRGAGGTDLGVGWEDHHAVDPELGTGDLGLDGDQPLADLGGGGVHLDQRFAGDQRQADPGGRVVVEAFGVADVLEPDRVADPAPDALTVGHVGDPAGQSTEVEGLGGAFAGLRPGLEPPEQLGHGGGPFDGLAGG